MDALIGECLRSDSMQKLRHKALPKFERRCGVRNKDSHGKFAAAHSALIKSYLKSLF